MTNFRAWEKRIAYLAFMVFAFGVVYMARLMIVTSKNVWPAVTITMIVCAMIVTLAFMGAVTFERVNLNRLAEKVPR